MQSCHASLEAGRAFDFNDHTHIVLLKINDKKALLLAQDMLEYNGIQSKMFFEPDDQVGHTALCTEPISGAKRKHFAKYQLWKA